MNTTIKSNLRADWGAPIKAGRNLQLFPESINTVDYNSIRNAVRFYSTKIFSIGPQITRMYFKEYFILYWSGDWIIQSSKDKQGFLSRNGKEYELIYKHPTTRGRILHNPDSQFMLSFREPFVDFKLNSVVIISAKKESSHANR